jgi:hypothetical protein
MIKLIKILCKINGKWKKMSPNDITENLLNGAVIQTESKRKFIIKEIK